MSTIFTHQKVLSVQKAINRFSRAQGNIIPHIEEDGNLGLATKGAIKRAKYFLGYLSKYQTWSNIDSNFLKRLAHPTYKFRPFQVARGLYRRRQARKIDTSTVRGCAKYLLKSPHARFIYVDSRGDTARNPIQDLANGNLAYVNNNGSRTKVKLSMMQALVDMAKQGTIFINCLTNGHHSSGSHHYSGTAVDLDNSSPLGYSAIVRTANRHGGYKNFETSHYHLDF